MNDPKVTKWITESLNRELGKDPDTGEPANVELVSWRIEEDPFNGKSVHIVATAWGDPETFKGRYWEGEWELEGDRIPDASEVWGD